MQFSRSCLRVNHTVHVVLSDTKLKLIGYLIHLRDIVADLSHQVVNSFRLSLDNKTIVFVASLLPVISQEFAFMDAFLTGKFPSLVAIYSHSVVFLPIFFKTEYLERFTVWIIDA